MMQELMQAIHARTGLPAEKAEEAARAGLDFLSGRMPAGPGDSLEDIIAGNSDGIADAVGGLADKAKVLFG